MKIILVSNYLNMHMLPLCEAFNKNPHIDDFYFIALQRQSEMRTNMGFADINSSYSFVCKAYENHNLYRRALQLVRDADVAIIGEAPDEWILNRMRNNKLTFLSSERFYKLGLWRRFVPSSYIKKKKRFLQYKDMNLYYLTIGAYLPYELCLLGFSVEKCFQWAYFPSVLNLNRQYGSEKNNSLKLLWAGRMQHVKHPEIAVWIASILKWSGIEITLNMIGDGPVLEDVKRIAERRKLLNDIHFLGRCLPESVQKQMAESDIFLFTSDFWEGWGAVLSESMAQGCISVASYKAGASEILIENGKNGFTYHSVGQAVQIIRKLYMEPSVRKAISAEAKKTIGIKWNPQAAADRFVTVADSILSDKHIPEYADGPMGKVVIRKAKNYFNTSF